MGPPKRVPAKKDAIDFAAAFAGLKAILAPYAGRLRVTSDDRQLYYLETVSASFRGRPVAFGGVRTGKAYVSFHLMPMYEPKLLARMSTELKKRMQGKCCFNFKAPDPTLFAELAEITEAGFRSYESKGWL